MHVRLAIGALPALLAVTACRAESGEARASAVTRSGEVRARPATSLGSPARATWRFAPADLRSAIETRVRGEAPTAVTAAQWGCVRALYDRTGFVPVWLDTAGSDVRTRALVRELAGASSHGLTVVPAQLDSLRSVLARIGDGNKASADDVANADVLLSAAFVALAEDLLVGQLDPRVVTRGWHISPRRSDIDSVIVQRAIATPVDSVVRALAPDDPVYSDMRDQLAKYRELDARGGWGTVPAGPTLRVGSRSDSARLIALVRRLEREGFLPDSGWSGEVFDQRLADAVKRFQAHHAMEVDGTLSPATVKALNRPAAYRVAQIAANLERIRWLPRAMKERHLIVNVPSFRLLLREGARTLSTMKVVVGADYQDRATPVFADSMSYVVFQPYWNVTPTIAVNEIIPKASRDGGYLARNGYEVVRGDGDDAPVVSNSALTVSAVRANRVRVRQKPGGQNALGHAKFIFPNAYNIYLHDSPQRALFEPDVRAFSHGCIRVERPADLASWVLGWDSTRVAAALASDRSNQYVPLTRKLPVFIIYLTAFTRDGELFFGNDLYSRDDDLVKHVTRGALPDARTRAALDAFSRLATR